MADRPIPFSDPMVAALLAGRKTQTRRAIPENVVDAYYEYDDWCSNVSAGVPTYRQWEKEFFLERCRYAVGDRLWVRETYYQFGHWELIPDAKTKGGKPKWGFVADKDEIRFDASTLPAHRSGFLRSDPGTSIWHKRLGRFMPKAASRMTLIVNAVKVERLQDITLRDLECEGLVPRGECWGTQEAHQEWIKLWDSINGPGAWDANPWVVAIGFSVVRANIDSLPPAPEVGK